MARSDDSRGRDNGEFAGRRQLLGATMLPAIDPLLAAGNRLFEGWMAVGNEILEFSRSRLDQGVAMGREMAGTTTLDGAIDVQARFARSMIEDCFSEAGKIADLGTRSLLDSLSSLSNQRRSSPASEPRAEQAAAE